MELFYSTDIANGLCTLAEEESRHCSKVLRHVPGDKINVIDGNGTLYTCSIIECGKQVVCSIECAQEGFGAHNYHLTMAVCPTKNIDRYEWFLEKATEMGVDVIVPIIGEHSERRIIKPDRLEKILVSAAKQSLKGAVPQLKDVVTVKQFIQETATRKSDTQSTEQDSAQNKDASQRQGLEQIPEVKLIAYCGEQDKATLAQAVAQAKEHCHLKRGKEHTSLADAPLNRVVAVPRITILIGPEGDFSPAEVEAAIAAGYKPLTLGDSRLRTETAAVAAVAGVYFMIP